MDELYAYFYVTYPDADRDKYDPLFTNISTADISVETGDTILRKIKQRNLLLQLSEKAYEATQGRADVLDIRNLFGMVDAGETMGMEEDTFVSDDLGFLLQSAVQKPGLRWKLNCLNKSLGSLRKGDFGFVFARPETGKTTFLASQISHMLTQTDQPILWFNNEEQGDKVMLRVYQAFFGCKLYELLAHTKQYHEEFRSRVGGRFLLVDNANIDRTTAEKIIEKVQPALIVYDQIDKVKGFKADRDDLVYGAIYQWARELAKAYAATIGVCQAGGMAEGQRWLTMDHVANAKTSKQAEADFIMGIGKTHEIGAENVRYINLSKNKLFGDQDSLPNLRHGRFEVLIEPETAQYKDVVDYN